MSKNAQHWLCQAHAFSILAQRLHKLLRKLIADNKSGLPKP